MLDVKWLGDRIKSLRKQKGLTQSTFAEELCVSYQAVSNWERGIAPPELDNLMRIASYFGVLVDDLLRPHHADPLFLGVDGGGTKTEFVITDSEGRVLKRFTKAGSNPNDIGLDASLALVSEGIREALVEFPSISFAFFGISGISAGDQRKRMTALLHEQYPLLKFNIHTDAMNFFALDDEADMIAISGTGSVVFVRKEDELVRVGGWGYLFDNAGSAYDVGRDAIATALAEEDANESPSVLTLLLRETLETPLIWNAINKIYSKGKPYIASLAKIVFEAYKQGDPKAIAIIDRNAKRLAEMFEIGIKTHKARPRAVVGGGLFQHYADVMLPHVAAYTDTHILVCELPPVYGACREARKLMNHDISEDFYTNFQNSYKGAVK